MSKDTTKASMRARAWARTAINDARDKHRAAIRDGYTVKASAISFDEFLRRFKAGKLKLRPRKKDSCNCPDMHTQLFQVFEVGDPYNRTDNAATRFATDSLDALVDDATRRVSLGAVTLADLEAEVKRVQSWTLPTAKKASK